MKPPAPNPTIDPVYRELDNKLRRNEAEYLALSTKMNELRRQRAILKMRRAMARIMLWMRTDPTRVHVTYRSKDYVVIGVALPENIDKLRENDRKIVVKYQTPGGEVKTANIDYSNVYFDD